MQFSKLFVGPLLLAASQAAATPVYYGFDGTVTGSSLAGYQIGQHVHYQFLVDTELPGLYLEEGKQVPLQDIGNPGDFIHVDYFFADFVGGDAFAKPVSGGGMNYGYDETSAGGAFGYIEMSSDAETGFEDLSVLIFGSTLTDGVVSVTGGTGTHYLRDGNGREGTVTTDLTLTSVTPAAVPEPSSLACLALGALAIGLAVRRPAQA